jgi:hypothetical protein
LFEYLIFLITNKKENIQSISEHICVSLDKIINDLQKIKEINDNYDIMYLFNTESSTLFKTKYKFKINHVKDICPNNIDFHEDGCVLPPCKSSHIELVFNPRPSLKKNTSPIFDEKVVLYIELVYLKEVDLNKLKVLLLKKVDEFNYLNLRGLYLFSELILNRTKEYNIDYYRNNILKKLYTGIDIKNEYLTLIHTYKQLFSDRSDTDFKMSKLLKTYISLYDDDILNDYNSNIIELLRPYINTALINIKDSLNEDEILFITGGDAYRRYITDITRTNDIDCKLISPNPDNRLYLILEKLSDLITILYTNKNSIFPKNIQRTIYNSNIKLVFKSVYESGQFRIRIINKDDFKIISIDYRCKIDININDQNILESISHEIPFIDIVLTSKMVDFKNDINKSSTIPVASADYLKGDIINIYDNISENLKLRYIKSSKDKTRLENIISFIEKSRELTNNRNIKRKIDDLLLNLLNSDKSQGNIKHKKINIDNNLSDTLSKLNINDKPIIYFPQFLEKHFSNDYYKSLLNTTLKNKYFNLIKSKYTEHKDEYKIQLNFSDIQELN